MCRSEPEVQGPRQRRVHLLSTPTAQYMLYRMTALMMAQSIAPIINLGLNIMPIPPRSMRQKEARPGVNVLFVL